MDQGRVVKSSACEGHQDSQDPVLARGTEGSSQSRASWGWGNPPGFLCQAAAQCSDRVQARYQLPPC